jgi:hypothetical protein
VLTAKEEKPVVIKQEDGQLVEREREGKKEDQGRKSRQRRKKKTWK